MRPTPVVADLEHIDLWRCATHGLTEEPIRTREDKHACPKCRRSVRPERFLPESSITALVLRAVQIGKASTARFVPEEQS